MKDSTTSRCTEVRTLDAPDAIISSDGSAMGDVGSVSSFLTRRLGLIVGCCMGFIVFLLLVSVLGYLKVKKQREAVKREQQPIPPEYISYRHFSIQSGEAGHAAARQTSQDGQHPNFISNTTLNVWEKSRNSRLVEVSNVWAESMDSSVFASSKGSPTRGSFEFTRQMISNCLSNFRHDVKLFYELRKLRFAISGVVRSSDTHRGC